MKILIISIALTLIQLTSLNLMAADFMVPEKIYSNEKPNPSQQQVSKLLFQKLEQVYAQMDNKDWTGAMDNLSLLATKVKNPFEQATVFKTAAYVYLSMEDNTKSIELFELVLTMNALSRLEQHSLTYNLAQLYLANQQYQMSVNYYKKWFSNEASPKSTDHVNLATAYQLNSQLEQAIEQYKIAVKQNESLNIEVPETWYQQLLASHYQLEQYPQSIDVLKVLISQYPEKLKYWQQLAGLYEWQEEPVKALSIWELAHKNKLLSKESDLLRLVYLLQQQGYPLKASELLNGFINNKQVTSDYDNNLLLAKLHQQAQQIADAIEQYSQAIILDPSKNDYEIQVNLLIQQANWQQALDILNTAKTKKNGQHYQLVGYVNFELKQLKESLAAYKKALAFADSKKDAQAWVDYLEVLIKE